MEMNERTFLENYDPHKYVGKYGLQSVTTDIAVFSIGEREILNQRKLSEKFLKILLVKRGGHPEMGKWALPGGFINNDTPEVAAHRELHTETNAENVYLQQIGTWGERDRDSRVQAGLRIISTAFMALIDSKKTTVKAGDDAADAAWFEVRISKYEGGILLEFINDEKGLKLQACATVTKYIHGVSADIRYRLDDSRECDLAFDHIEMILVGLDYLRDKAKNSNIVFNLMPHEFTFSELQQVYEVILGHDLLVPAFRRKLWNKGNGYLEKTGTEKSEGQYRPSELYRYSGKTEEGYGL